MKIELNYEERLRLGALVMEVLDDWGIEGNVQMSLLGMPEKTRPRELNRLRSGSTPFPESDDSVQRARHILGIQNALHLIFPRNPHMPAFWLTNPNNRQFGRAPLEVMIEEGLSGMSRVWGHLDCTQGWD